MNENAPSSVDKSSPAEKGKDVLRTLDQLTQENNPEQLKKGLRTLLLEFDQIDDKANLLREEIKSALEKARQVIETVKNKYPDDPELIFFETSYANLKNDFEQEKPLDLETFEPLTKGLQQEIADRKLIKKTPDELKDDRVFQQLQKIGAAPIYAVHPNEQAENKKDINVILLLQSHTNPGLPDELEKAIGVARSRTEIEKIILSSSQSHITNTVLNEGWPSDKPIPDWLFKSNAPSIDGAIDATRKNPDIQLKGYENLSYFDPLVTKSPKTELFWRYRMTAGNIFIAAEVEEQVKKIQQKDGTKTFLMTLGAGHEKGKDQTVAISDTLASFGLNVYVVDCASQYMDKKAFETWLKKQPISPEKKEAWRRDFNAIAPADKPAIKTKKRN